MDKRTIIAVVLSVAILFAWQYFFSPKMSEQQKPQAGAPQGQVQGGAPAQPSQAGAKGPQIAPVQVPGQAPAAGAQAPAAGQPVPAAQPPIPGVQAAAEPKAAAQSKPARKITVETPTMTVTLTDIGGGITDVRLKEYKETLDSPEGKESSRIQRRTAISPPSRR